MLSVNYTGEVDKYLSCIFNYSITMDTVYKQVEIVDIPAIPAPVICFTIAVPDEMIDNIGEPKLLLLLAQHYFNINGQIVRMSIKIDDIPYRKFFQPITTLN